MKRIGVARIIKVALASLLVVSLFFVFVTLALDGRSSDAGNPHADIGQNRSTAGEKPLVGLTRQAPLCWEEISLPDNGAARAEDDFEDDHPATAFLTNQSYNLADITIGNPLNRPGHRNTDLIVIAKVVDSEAFQSAVGSLELPQTMLTLEIEESLRGHAQVGERIFVAEVGGVHQPRIYEPVEPTADNPFGKPPVDGGEEGVDYTRGGPVESGFRGVPVMKTGERYLLFLYEYEGPDPEGTYTVVQGAFQGKMRVADNGMLEFTGSQDLLPVEAVDVPLRESTPENPVWSRSPSAYQLPALLHGCPLEEVTAGIRDILASKD